MIRCAECNEENVDGLEYCDSCGAKLEVIATEAVVADAPDSPDAEETPVEIEASAETAAEEATSEPETAAAEGEERAEAAGDEPPEPAAEEAVPVAAALSEEREAVGSASLTITRGGTVGKVFELQAGDNLVGRWDPDSGSFPEVDMENDDPEARISRKHALIKFGTDLTIEDIGSLNGTFVNRGQRLEPGSPAPLKDGDEIIIGKTFFKVSRVQ